MSAPAARLAALAAHLTADGEGCAPSLTADPTAGPAAAPAPREWVYTVDPAPGAPPVLTPAQRDFYEEHGYLVFKKLVPEADLEMYRAHFMDLCEGRAPRTPMMTLMRDGAAVSSRPSPPAVCARVL